MSLTEALNKLQRILEVLIGDCANEWRFQMQSTCFSTDKEWAKHLLAVHKDFCHNKDCALHDKHIHIYDKYRLKRRSTFTPLTSTRSKCKIRRTVPSRCKTRTFLRNKFRQSPNFPLSNTDSTLQNDGVDDTEIIPVSSHAQSLNINPKTVIHSEPDEIVLIPSDEELDNSNVRDLAVNSTDTETTTFATNYGTYTPNDSFAKLADSYAAVTPSHSYGYENELLHSAERSYYDEKNDVSEIKTIKLEEDDDPPSQNIIVSGINKSPRNISIPTDNSGPMSSPTVCNDLSNPSDDNNGDEVYYWIHNMMSTMTFDPNLNRYICPICFKGYKQKSSVKCHLYTHAGVKSYTCDICGQSFSQYATLYNHRSNHTSGSFECFLCDFKTESFQRWQQHKRFHQGSQYQ